MNKPFITKTELIEKLTMCSQKTMSAEQLQEWMITVYDPPDVEIGPDENEDVQEAMNIIMNEYELAKTDKFKIEGYQFALEFLQADEESFFQKRYHFIHDGFLD